VIRRASVSSPGATARESMAGESAFTPPRRCDGEGPAKAQDDVRASFSGGLARSKGRELEAIAGPGL
jgi:hypothetical protein